MQNKFPPDSSALLEKLSDSELISRFRERIIEEHESLVGLLEELGEMDRRKLFFQYESLKSYLVSEYRMEEWVAELRIRVARLMRKFPVIRAGLESGRLNLSLIDLVQSCRYREKLGDEEFIQLLGMVSGMSVRAAQRELARLYPTAGVDLPKDRIRPLTEELSEVRFVADSKLLEKLEELRGLLAHSHPKLSMAELISIAVNEYLERHHPREKAKRAEAREAKRVQADLKTLDIKADRIQPNSSSVAIQDATSGPTTSSFGTPDTVKDQNTANASEENCRIPSQSLIHALTQTQGYRCAYLDPVTQKRCISTFALEKDHRQSWASGGKTELKNLRYLCRAHHRRISFLEFGDVAQYFRPK